MKKKRKVLLYFVFILLTYLLLAPVARAQNFDPEAISQVSKGLTDSNLLNQGHHSAPKVGSGKETGRGSPGMSAQEQEGAPSLPVAAAFDMGAIPLELRDLATKVKEQYGDNIHIAIDRSLEKPGMFVGRHYYKVGDRTVFGPAVILINPDKLKPSGVTYGEVLAHEMGHALDPPSRIRDPRLKEVNPMKENVLYQSKINAKIAGNPVRLRMAQQQDYALRDPLYLATQKVHLSRLPEAKVLQLPQSYFPQMPSTPMSIRVPALPRIK